MTLHTDGIGTSAKLRVGWMDNAMIAVTHHTSWKRSCLERGFVRALFVHLGLENVTGRAHVLNLVHPWRRRAVVPVTRRTSRRTQIPSDRERIVVDACAVLCELICGNGVSPHVIRISMATSACIGHIDWINR